MKQALITALQKQLSSMNIRYTDLVFSLFCTSNLLCIAKPYQIINRLSEMV